MAPTRQTAEEPGQLLTEINAEQALGLVSYRLMQRLASEGQGELPWIEAEESGPSILVRQLRHRLELTSLAIETGAPLTTSEVTYLLGARPGSEVVERGGLQARRVSRNVWRLTRMEEAESHSSAHFVENRFRRRL